ncbi:MAG: RES family NAD+ phosphorylase [bacterium]|nr:RES family NAD+ phosphorylase [bacterium]
MAGLRPRRVEGVWHRFVAELHKDDADSDQGALEHGGRYNPRREYGALYLSESPAACRAEMLRRPGVRVRYWHARIKVRVAKALDLTDPSTRDKLCILREDLVSNEWGATQDLGRAARRAGFDALIVPSAAGNHHNLVVFTDLLADDETSVPEHVEPAPQEP